MICNDIHHNVKECNKINYVPDKEKIYLRNKYSVYFEGD